MKIRSLVVLLALGASWLVPASSVARGGEVSIEGAVDIAQAHVRRNASTWRLNATDVAELAVTDAYISRHNGVRHVYLVQRLNGLDVNGARMSVGILRDGRVFHVGSRFLPLTPAPAGTIMPAGDALSAAARALSLRTPRVVRTLEGPQGRARETVLSDGGIARSPIGARLVYEPTPSGLRAAWNLEIEEASAEHWWNVSVDASTGALLSKHDYVAREDAAAIRDAVARDPREMPVRASARIPADAEPADGATYRVYAHPLESPNDGARSLVSNPADELGSPYGWHDLDGVPGADSTTTSGNNVDAYADPAAANRPLPGSQPDAGRSLLFDYPIDFAKPPITWRNAAVTNLFYWNNIIHDVTYRYGFDERSGNFQVNDYDRGFSGGDPVRAEAQDGSGVDNANFATPPEGNSPRMQMFLWANRSRGPLIDGDLDAGVIIHEYTHGISNRLTGGPQTTACLQNDEQAGEGWSDFLAIALTAREGDVGTAKRGVGTYVSGQPDRANAGIRPQPYTTRLGANNATYDRIKTESIPHGVGWVWASMLWEVYWELVGIHGFNPDVYGDWTTGGNNLAIQLVIDGMKLQTCSPGFVDARDAILAADVALTGGANTCPIWRAFAKRKLGFSATQGSSTSVTDGVQAGDLHPDCV